MGNFAIKELIRESRFYQYEIAAKIGVSEVAFSQWFRTNIDGERKERILNAIEDLKAGR